MKVVHSLSELPKNLKFALSVGVFDGVHLGHQKLIDTLKKTKAPTLLITFTNHPAEILRPNNIPKILTPIDLKLKLLENCGIDWVLLLPFTLDLAHLSFEQLLDPIPLSHLVIGKGDSFGKDRLGNETNLKTYTQKRNIELHIVEKSAVSSSMIRKLIEQQKFDEASKLLGRAYLMEKSI